MPDQLAGPFRQGSAIVLPAVRIRTRTVALHAIIFLVVVFATVDTLRSFLHDFVIRERALLTPRGRERFRTRRRTRDKLRLCDETNVPRLMWLPRVPFGNAGWRGLSSCVEYDLSLRRRPLGDEGTRCLVGLLSNEEYATGHLDGRLRVLNLERRGAGYLARWLSVDPVAADEGTVDLLDVERIPTAASRSVFINLRGNPIGNLGVKDLERAVDKAKLNGVKVVIVGGGASSEDARVVDGRGGRAGQHVHVVKLGPIEYTRRSVEMRPWRLPVPLLQKVGAKVRAHSLSPSLKALVIFFIGFSIGRASTGMIPYRLVIVRDDRERR